MWDPTRELTTLQERMNRLFENAAQRRYRGDEENEREMERADWYPPADVYERETEYVIALDLPGIQRNALDVSLDNDQLTIRGERAAEGEASQRRAERPFGRFVRSFSLPAIVDRKAIAADYKDGVLRLRLPKRAEQKANRLKIKVS